MIQDSEQIQPWNDPDIRISRWSYIILTYIEDNMFLMNKWMGNLSREQKLLKSNQIKILEPKKIIFKLQMH